MKKNVFAVICVPNTPDRPETEPDEVREEAVNGLKRHFDNVTLMGSGAADQEGWDSVLESQEKFENLFEFVYIDGNLGFNKNRFNEIERLMYEDEVNRRIYFLTLKVN